jgi:hypothetical protein
MTSIFSTSDALKALETYGHDFSLWPDQALAKFVKNNIDFAQDIHDAAKLDAALNHYNAPPPSDLLSLRILKAAATSPQRVTPQDIIQEDITQKEIKIPPQAGQSHTAPTRSRPVILRHGITRIAASLLACLAVGFGVTHIQERNNIEAAMMAETETDALRRAANDMGMADIFLWVELGDTAL